MKKALFLFTLVGISCFLFAQNKPTIEFVSIPAGTFTMGSPENEPAAIYNSLGFRIVRDISPK